MKRGAPLTSCITFRFGINGIVVHFTGLSFTIASPHTKKRKVINKRN